MSDTTKKEWTSIVFQKKSIPRLMRLLNQLRGKVSKDSTLFLGLNRFLETVVSDILEKHLENLGKDNEEIT